MAGVERNEKVKLQRVPKDCTDSGDTKQWVKHGGVQEEQIYFWTFEGRGGITGLGL